MPSSKTLAQAFLKLSLQDDADAQIENLFAYIESKNLNALLPQVREHVLRMKEESNTFNTLVIDSRFELDSQEEGKIKDITEAPEDVKVINNIDPELVGSFQATYRGKIYDGSLKSAVSQLNKALSA